jgi:predicted Fe-Mo cluster-binding NifX family protein
MKIAVITDDGITISRHFGRAPHYMVVTVENWEITARELRDKLGHVNFKDENHEHHDHISGHQGHVHESGHGFGQDAHDKHLRMAESIRDCEAVLCRGMGAGAYHSMQQAGIRPVVTDIEDIEEAVLAYANGQIVDQIEKLH